MRRGSISLLKRIDGVLSGNSSFATTSASEKLKNAPSLSEFLRGNSLGASDAARPPEASPSPFLPAQGARRNVYIETYGCQMNSSDSEIVLGILSGAGYSRVDSASAADVVLVNTCAIREGAEQRVWGRLGVFKGLKAARRAQKGAGPVVGVLGCMAERLKTKLLESDRLVDVVAGPDAYRDLPRLLDAVSGRSDLSSAEASSDTEPEAATREASGSEAGPSDRAASAAAHPLPRRRGAKDRPPRLTAINVQLSAEETYADVAPVRQSGAVSAFISIMRGCNNMCSFCIVPHTRGRERSRPAASIEEEVRRLADEGVREITLLGQNVNSYSDRSHLEESGGGAEGAAVSVSDATAAAAAAADPYAAHYARGFRSVYRPDRARRGALPFAELLRRCAEAAPEVRLRFTSPHPKDFSDSVLDVVASYPNVCKQIHMPAQSGSTRMLELMKRGYSREDYLALAHHIRERVPGVALSTDMIAGFCGETEADHSDSLSLLRSVRYEHAFLFAYSLRDKTHAARHYQDDVPEDVKGRRLRELMAAHREGFDASQREEVGRVHRVLLEGPSPRSDREWIGRTCTNKKVIVPFGPVAASYRPQGTAQAAQVSGPTVELASGMEVAVRIEAVRAGVTLGGTPLGRTTIRDFAELHGGRPFVAPVGA